MRPTLLAAALLAAALPWPCPSAPAAPGEGEEPSAPGASEDDDWVTLRNDMETLEFRVPPGYVPKELTNPNTVIYGSWPEGPHKSVIVTGFAYAWTHGLEEFMKFVVKDVNGTALEYAPGSNSRFTCERMGTERTVYIAFVEARAEKEQAFYVRALVEKEMFLKDRETWTKVLDSIKTQSKPEDPFKIPAGWKVLRTTVFATLGPLESVQDKKAKDLFDRRLFEVNAIVDDNEDAIRFARMLTEDKRQWTRRRPIHVYPTPDAFKAACGDAWVEGATVVYLPDHPDRVLAVDGSPGVVLDKGEILPLASVSYLEGRLGRLPAWMRVAFRSYLNYGAKRGYKPGLFPDAVLKKAKDLFSKHPLPFEDALALDAAKARALDENGRLSCWGYLQYGFHGPEAPVRDMFRGFLKNTIGSEDASVAWGKAVAAYERATKKPFKTKDFESGAKKWLKSMK